MDWDRYKQLCDTPNVFSRWMLEQTGELVDADLRMLVASELAGTPLAKPADHRGGAATDMFELAFTRGQVLRICRCVEEAAAAGRTTRATTGRGLGGFREAWAEYLRTLDEAGVP